MNRTEGENLAARGPTRFAGRLYSVLGWTAVVLTAAMASLWAVWGAIENFYEGWYEPTLLANLGLMLVQYLLPALAFVLLGLAALRWRRAGAALLVAAGAGAAAFFRTPAGIVLVALPLTVLALLWWFGRPPPRRWAVAVLVALPLTAALAAGTPGALRVASRVDDGYRGPQTVAGSSGTLTWAPQGPGWPLTGDTWDRASWTCAHLDEAGSAVSSAVTGPWRLPTAAEVVGSLTLHGRMAGGSWDAQKATATYRVQPDKESPLWDSRSRVIYFWTATTSGRYDAYALSYNGTVETFPKGYRPAYLGWRCVRS